MTRPVNPFFAGLAVAAWALLPGAGLAGVTAAPAPEPDILTLVAAGSIAAAVVIKLRKK